MRICRFLVCLMLLTPLCVASGAFGQNPPPRQSLALASQEWKRTFDAVEAYIRAPGKNPEAQNRYAQAVLSVITEAALFREEAEQQLVSQQRLLDALGPPPAEGQPPEDSRIAQQRKELTGTIAGYKGRIAEADVAITRARTLQQQLSEAYRADFRSRILERQPSLLSPAYLREAMNSGLAIFAAMTQAPVVWYRQLDAQQRSDLWFGWRTLLIVAAALAAWPIRRLLLRRFGPDPQIARPTYARRLLAAIAVAVANGLIPSVLLIAIYLRVKTDLSLDDGLAADVIKQTSLALLFFIVARALAKAALAPDNPTWRLTRLTPASARRLYTAITFLAFVYVLDQSMSRASASLRPGDDVHVLWSLVMGSAEAFGFWLLTRSRRWQSGPPTEPATRELQADAAVAADEPPPHRQSRLSVWLRNAVAAAAIGSVIAVIAGYVALGDHIIEVLLNCSIVFAALYVVKRLAEESIGVLSSAHIRGGRVTFDGEERGNLRFWLTAIVNVLIYGLALYAVLIIVGLPRAEVDRWAVNALGGFAIGGVTISFTDIGAAILVFIVGVLAAARVRRVLDHTVLPRTNLDAGVRNSVATAAGYAGVVIAGIIAVAVAGIDVSNLAIVAGALSVGIGFGLQTIVNNFVSGLILLAERPFKVGDWVVVGSQQGYVRKISVRATEIQMFDRSSVIVPNSTLLSQSVVNLTHKDKSGRVEIRVGVAYGSDVQKVRETLLACANAHAEVVSWPKPAVFFVEFGASSLDFILYAYLSDVEKRLTVGSELRFAIDGAFREAGIEIPFTQTDVHLRDLDKLVDVLRPPVGAPPPSPEPAPLNASSVAPPAASPTAPSGGAAAPPPAVTPAEAAIGPEDGDVAHLLKRPARPTLDSI